MTFQKAVKHEAKLRLAIAGPSGSGKTYTSLAIATALANGGKIALVDTEHGSASKYADLFEFDVLELTAPFHPRRFVEAITEAGKAGYSVIILDSLTHAWSGPGGLLEIVDGIAARMKSANTFAAWKDATPIQNGLVEGIVAAPLHLIATMRSKQEYILTQDERGKQVPRKVGMAPQQRDGFEYEFDVFIDMDIDNTGIVQKTRCPALTGGVFKKPGADMASILLKWLQGAPAQQPKPAAPAGPVWTPDAANDAAFETLPSASAERAGNGKAPASGAKHDPARAWDDERKDEAVAWAMRRYPEIFEAKPHARKSLDKLIRELGQDGTVNTPPDTIARAWKEKCAAKQDELDAKKLQAVLDAQAAGDEKPGF
jgi:hypothetical protein